MNRFHSLQTTIAMAMIALLVLPASLMVAGDRDGDTKTEDPTPAAIARAAAWLLDHQNANGSWTHDEWAKSGIAAGRKGADTNKDGSPTGGQQAAAVRNTGMATLALIRSGAPTDTEADAARLASAIEKALRWLVGNQQTNGLIALPDASFASNYEHAVAMIALSEGLARVSDDELRSSIRTTLTRGVEYIMLAQNLKGDGRYGWRFGIRPGESSSLVTGWMLLALHHAAAAEIDVPKAVVDGGLAALIDLTGTVKAADGREIWRTGYIQKAGTFAQMMSAMRGGYVVHDTGDAIHVHARHTIVNAMPEEDKLGKAAVDSEVNELLADAPSMEKAKNDYLYWFFGTQALKEHGGAAWPKWANSTRTALLGTQRTDGDATSQCHGSWDTTQAWGVECGRVYDTAINLVTLTTVGPKSSTPEVKAGDKKDAPKAERTGQVFPAGSDEYKRFIELLKLVVPASHPALTAGSASEAADSLGGLHRTKFERFLSSQISRTQGAERDLLREFRKLVRTEE